MDAQNSTIFTQSDADASLLQNAIIAVIGYGNQGRAQALNLRDSGVRVVIGNRSDNYRQVARADGFEVKEIADAVAQADSVMMLLPDEVLPGVFEGHIQPNLRPNTALVFASGYSVAFDQVILPKNVDVLLLAPRMIGVGVRERYLTKQGFYCLVGVHQNASGAAQEKLLALTQAVSGLYKPAIEVSFKQEAILDLFNEQAFGPAFGRVLLSAISVLLDHGLPPEAVLVEMYMSEEMAYTYQKMAQVGLVKQTLFHSPTSQYGAMSRGIRFMDLRLKDKMKKIYAEIDRGDFAREWQNPISRLKFKAIRFFAMRQWINKVETRVRKALGMKNVDVYQTPADINDILNHAAIQAELARFEDSFEI